MIASFVCGQSVYMHEAAEEAGRIDHFSLWDIVATIIAFILGIGSWYMVRTLSKLSFGIIIASGVSVAVVFFSLLIFIDFTITSDINEKKEYLHNKACQSFFNCIQDSKIIIEKDYELLSSEPILKEVDKGDFGKVRDLPRKYDEYFTFPFDHSGQGDGVYYCYYLEFAPHFDVYYFKNETNLINDYSEPSLYKCRIAPCYIRYFSNRPNPEYDVKHNTWNLFQTFNDRVDTKYMDNIEKRFRQIVENDYFWLGFDGKCSSFWDNKAEVGGPCVGLDSKIREFCSIKTNEYENLFGISEQGRSFVDEKGRDGGFRLVNGLAISDAKKQEIIENAYNRLYFVFGIAFLIVISALLRKMYINKKCHQDILKN